MVDETLTYADNAFDDYQRETTKTAFFDNGAVPPLAYCTLGLVGEAGEVAEKVKKLFRDKGGEFYPSDVEALTKELGDVMWYLAQLADALGVPLSTVASTNIRKLQARRLQDTLSGSGDDR